MAQKSIFDELIGSLGDAGAAQQGGGQGMGGLGDLLGQLTGGGAQGSGGGGLADMLGQLTGAGGGAAGAQGGLSDMLRQVQASLGGAATSAGGFGERASEMVGDRPSFAKGAAAGGLIGALLGGKGTAKAAGAVLVGSLAYKAYQQWKAQQAAHAGAPAPTDPDAEAFIPSDEQAANSIASKLVVAMVGAAKADGRVTSLERKRILDELADRGLGDEAAQFLQQQLDGPANPEHVATLADSPEEAVQLYLASLLAVDPEGTAERTYLQRLAGALNLPASLVAKLHQEVAAA